MSPRPGISILITSAPIQANSLVAVGPAWTWPKSRTRTPSRALLIPSSPPQWARWPARDDEFTDRRHVGIRPPRRARSELYLGGRRSRRERLRLEHRGPSHSSSRGSGIAGIALEKIAVTLDMRGKIERVPAHQALGGFGVAPLQSL